MSVKIFTLQQSLSKRKNLSSVGVFMKAVIMAGGKGERLKPLTKKLPKPMLEIAGKPILGHQIELLKRHKIKDIVICGCYLFDKIKNYFGDGSKFGVRIQYIEDRELGTGGALKNAERLIDGEFLLLYGDTMLEMDLEKLIEFHKIHNATVTITLHETDHPHDSDLVSIDANGMVLKVFNKPNIDIPSKLAKTSVFVVEQAIFEEMPEVGDLEKDVIKKLIPGKVYGYVTDEFIKDVGTIDRYDEIRKRYEK